MAKLSLFNCVLLAGLAFSQLASAQFTNLPQCGQDCTSAAATANDCGANDSNCACAKQPFVDVAGQCIASECPAAERNTAYNRFMDICDGVPRGSPPPAPATSASASTPAAPPASASASAEPSTPTTTPEGDDDDDVTPTNNTPTREAAPTNTATRANAVVAEDDDAAPAGGATRPAANPTTSRPARASGSLSTRVVVQTVAPSGADTFFADNAASGVYVGRSALLAGVVAGVVAYGLF